MEYSDIEQLQMLIQQHVGAVSSQTGVGTKPFRMSLIRPANLGALSQEVGNIGGQGDLPGGKENEDADGGLTNEEQAQFADTMADEPIYFDQTTRHIGSIQKNMVLSERDRSLLNN